MIEPREELVRSWLIKANRDLLSAHELASAQTPLLDTAAYHCQQAVEKALKGYLLYNDVRFEKTHDIVLLLTQAVAVSSSFSAYFDAALLLAPLAVEYRYPGDYIEPEAEEYLEAYAAAQSMYAFILGTLPKESHP